MASTSARGREMLRRDQIRCERCGEVLRPRRAVYLELNCRTGEWDAPGASEWSGGPESQGCFPFGRTCAIHQLEAKVASGGRRK